jgi:DNA-binding LytR/AlgR family response regulator
MSAKNYKIIVPVSPSQCMEITTIHCEHSLLKHQDERPILKIYQTESIQSKEYLEVDPEHTDYHKILHLFKSKNKQLMQFHGQNETFMMATTTGFQIVPITNILYFDYNKAKKMWVAVLTNKNCLVLRRNTTADQILHFSTQFFRINQQHIINLSQLIRIDDKKCILASHPDNQTLQISRTYMKKLQEHFLMI